MKNTKILIYMLKFYFAKAEIMEKLVEKLVFENKYKIVGALFGAAHAAPNKVTTILY